MSGLWDLAVQNMRTQGGNMERDVMFVWRELEVTGVLYEGTGGDDPTTLEEIKFYTDEGGRLPDWLEDELTDKYMDALIVRAKDAE